VISFLKGNGTGNDFVIVRDIDIAGINRSILAQNVCHRHYGIGADGLLILSRPTMSGAEFLYEMINPDGSPSGRCGNGMRVALLAWERITQQGKATGLIQIGDQCHHFDRLDGLVSVELGRCFSRKPGPSEVSSLLPTTITSTHFIDVGNPHLILVTQTLPDNWAAISKDLEVHPVFPNRTNVHWVIPGGEVAKVSTWERGAGETLACGSGACAIAFAMPELNSFRFPGGMLRVKVSNDGMATLTGEAEISFSGEFPTTAEF
jgi:diaminopimelate epimerase